MISHEIQFSLFFTAPPLTNCTETLELMRPHKWAGGAVCELPLVSIELAPHAGKWMWYSSLNSRNGSAQTAKALPKWGKFAETKREALLRGVDDVLSFQWRATADERCRIAAWLGEQVSRGCE
ncbi:hypothetical protein [Pseudomonas savastanoi]|uniref:hypothetical protein n=1 Tax=Pseudomonas savastanoi TaxID=29438 RepID=UPI000E329DCB|nr:hypothetical protein [Pseudomonas savastanoi]